MTGTLAGSRARGAAIRRRVSVRGVVQGVGFRPFAHRLAGELGLSGFVGNDADGVFVEVEGDPAGVAEFCRRAAEDAPPLARVTEVVSTDMAPLGVDTFTIRPSEPGESRTLLPPDTATCEDCLRELADPADRRHRHPFITCTHCGPRFTIATALPYDRAATTMAAFPMCPQCAGEYADPADRRFHAQPIACPSCGPQLTLVTTRSGRPVPGRQGPHALVEARRLLAQGAILAVKGLGGYHLACDATDPHAVATLRARKARAARPFAVMCADLPGVERIARLSPAERAALTGPHRPIVLLRPHLPGAVPSLAPGVCHGSPYIGVLLPYTPLHHLLFGLPGDPAGPRILVMTSGNRSGEPIVTDDRDALSRLGGIADAWLTHDRVIESPCDDSVVRVTADGGEQVLRRSRGYVPRSIALPVTVRPALAVGGDLKNTLCLGAERRAWLSPHIGDMGGLVAVRAFEHGERRLRALTGVTPGLLAADRHPGYHSARWARRHAAGRPLRLVQHHHAHVASVMAEAGLDGTTPVIGVAFDGTGYGDDAAIWGGEVLLADYDGYRRLAHLAYLPLPGGDAAVANPCRTALAWLRAADLPWDPELPCVTACSATELRLLERQLEQRVACVPTSSMGRLFDAVSSLAGLCHRAEYEAQAAVELEAAAALAWADRPDGYRFAIRPAEESGGSAAALLDPVPVVRAIVADLRRGTPAGLIAARFHRAVAAAVAEICARLGRDTGVRTVALTGGVFANALLDEGCAARLTAVGFTVLRHRQVPPGDGGLALGQLVVAAHTEASDDRRTPCASPCPAAS